VKTQRGLDKVLWFQTYFICFCVVDRFVVKCSGFVVILSSAEITIIAVSATHTFNAVSTRPNIKKITEHTPVIKSEQY
jgi:hypothetical protein